MDRPEMKKLVYRQLSSYLLNLDLFDASHHEPGLNAEEFWEMLELYAYRKEEGTEPEKARLRSVVLEVIDEFRTRSRNMKKPFAVPSKPRRFA